ncbi:MAG: ABC transporter ATP-binding protein [Deltaproteobacteria bacterium]|nr:ABC transporter ATP-binding protein [Deltaproteobacteria bacterium]
MLDRILGKDIAHYVMDHRALLICAIILSTISAFFLVVPAYLLPPFADEAMKNASEPTAFKIPWIAFESGSLFSWHRTELVLIDNISPDRLLILLSTIAFFSILFKSITVYLGQLAAAAFSNRAILSLRRDLYNQFISLPLGFYHKQKTGTLISRATADLTVMQERIANIIIGLVQHPLTALIFLFYLLMMNYRLTLLVFLSAPLIIGLIRLFGGKVKKHSTRVQDGIALVTSAYQETLLLLKIIQGFCITDRQSKKFHDLISQLYKKVMHWNRWFLGLGPFMDSTTIVIVLVVIVIGKTYFNHTLGEIIAMFYAFQGIYNPIKNLAKVNNELRTLQGATERVFGIIKTTPEIQDRPGAMVLPRLRKSIEFKNVYFSYDPEIPILKDISFQVEAGQMVAFVGSTGAGKSTILDLIPRFYDVNEGSITIDGTDIRDVTIESLRKQIGIVSQEVLLFHDTIANNITCGADGQGEERIRKAAKSAHAHDFIMAQPAGYETIVGDRGTLLSGGQRQRISIARAIYADPTILLLDEVASALDAESEGLVEEAIGQLKGNRTILVVAHRLNTIREADRIYVIEGGMIVESGSHKDLLERNGRFRQLYDLQFGA